MLHAAAWTDVDGAEANPQDAAAVNVGGTQNAASLGAPLVAFSTDYVFDGTKRTPYVESDAPNPLSAYGRTKLHGEAAAGEGAWIVRSSWLFGPTGKNFVRTMLALGRERDEVSVVDDQRGSPTYVGHLAAAVGELDRAAAGHLARRCGRRLHVGRVRRGDLRGGGDRLPRPANHDRGVRAAGAAPRVFGAAERARAARPSCRTGAKDYAPASTGWASPPPSRRTARA